MKQVKGNIKTLHFYVQGRSKRGGPIWVPKERQWHPGDRSFSTNFLHILPSDFDDTDTLKSNGEKLVEDLSIGDKKKKKYLQNSEYEEGDDGNPNFGRDPKFVAGPNDAFEATDQPFKDPP